MSQMPYHPEWDYDTAIQKNLPKKEDITQETFMSRRLTKEGTGSYPFRSYTEKSVEINKQHKTIIQELSTLYNGWDTIHAELKSINDN